MRIGLINIDSKLPNIALHKIAMWHELRGDKVIWGNVFPTEVDKVYVSCILTKNYKKVWNYFAYFTNTIADGTGWDASLKLPLEIEQMKPKINYGFTTRGCIRKCKFCLVPEAEGGIRIEGDIYDIWDGKSKEITLFDNNILALPKHFKLICEQVKTENLTVDFNQGLDIRLINQELGEHLASIKTTDIRFAFDSPSIENIVKSKITMLRKIPKFSNKAFFFYVLSGYNTTFEEDLYRANLLKELGCRPYIMRHNNIDKNDTRYITLAEWANQMWTLAKYSYEEFCIERKKRHT